MQKLQLVTISSVVVEKTPNTYSANYISKEHISSNVFLVWLHNTDILSPLYSSTKMGFPKISAAILTVLLCISDMYKKYLQDGDSLKADVSDWSIHHHHLCVKHLRANLHQTEHCHSTRAC